jgi:4-hydroxybenzoyl-CoA reductase subunit beta
MELPAFHYHRPDSLDEVVSLLKLHRGQVDLVAGGTDLLPNYKNRLNARRHVVSLSNIDGLGQISATRIGAMARLSELERDETLRELLPLIPETAGYISSPPLREHGTVGGNLMLDTRCYYFNQSPMWRESVDFCLKAEGTKCLVVPSSTGHCYATYSGELAAALLVLGAEIELLGPEGSRQLPISEFFADEGIVRFNDPRPGEVLVAVHIPETAQDLSAGYSKLAIRDSIDFPSLGIALALKMTPQGSIERLHLATTAMSSRPESLDEVMLPFLGRSPSAGLAEEIGEAAKKASVAYRNVPLDPKYRRKMVAVFTRRLLGRLEPGFRP